MVVIEMQFCVPSNGFPGMGDIIIAKFKSLYFNLGWENGSPQTANFEE